MTATRYPIEPLLNALQITYDPTPGRRHDDTLELEGLAALAQALGISERWARRLHRNGLTERQADHHATRIGRHPATIWPTWWDDALSDADWYTDDPALDELDKPPLQPTLVA